jgi:hypothetical protein
MFTDGMITRMRHLLRDTNLENLEPVMNAQTNEELDRQERTEWLQEGLQAVKDKKRGVYAPIRHEVQTRIKNKT